MAGEQRLLQAQKMESIGQLTGGIAHDFNNLLAVIPGNLELPRKRIGDGERAKRLLAFSRRQYLPQAVDIPQLVSSTTYLLARSLGPSIQIATRFPSGLPPVKVDPNQLEMALLNLAVNARDVMPFSGTITISARTAKMAAGNDRGLSLGSYICVAASDTGMAWMRPR